MNAAILDHHIGPEHANPVASAMEDLAVTDGHVVRGDLDDISASTLGVDEIVFVDPGPGNLQSRDSVGFLKAPDNSPRADGPSIFRAGWFAQD
jgi:hypothetical protein